MKTDIEIIAEVEKLPVDRIKIYLGDWPDTHNLTYTEALHLMQLARQDERSEMREYLRHKDTCNISNWVDSGDVKCNCGLDDLPAPPRP